jgi:APA family basic amino acid/polyamine antiporter
MATAIVVGNMIGSGIFLLPSSHAAAGPVSIFARVFTGAGAILLAVVFANLGRNLPRTGGPYAYSRRAFGDFRGLSDRLSDRLGILDRRVGRKRRDRRGLRRVSRRVLGRARHKQPARCSGRDRPHLGADGANALGTRESGAIQVVTTVLKFVPLALIGLIGLFFSNGDNYTPFAPHGTWSAISAAAPLTLWAFIGLDSATVPAEEVKDPERTIPRGTILGTGITAVLYIVATVASWESCRRAGRPARPARSPTSPAPCSAGDGTRSSPWSP